MTEWRNMRLDSVAALGNGVNYNKTSFGTGVAIVGVRNFSDQLLARWVDLDEVDTSAVRGKAQILRDGDLLFVRSNGNPSLVGRCLFVANPPLATHSAFTIRARIIDPQILDPRFAALQMRHIHRSGQIVGANGTNITNLTQAVLGGVKLSVPPLFLQRRIADTLWSLEELIENNRRRIEILEEFTFSLFQEWFARYRFPGYESIDFVDTQLGPIPSDWRVGTLNDLLVLQRGFDLPKKDRVSGSVPVVAATGVHGFHDRTAVKGPGVVTGRSGSLGTVLYISDDFWPLNTTLWVKEFREASPEFAYCLLKSLKLERFNSGAAVPTLNRNDIAQHPVVVPPAATIKLFSDNARDAFACAEALKNTSAALRTARDLLLSALVTGRVDVRSLSVDDVFGWVDLAGASL